MGVLRSPRTTRLRAYDVRLNVAALKRNNVPGYGGAYLGFIHPDNSFDLWQESGNQALIAPQIYSAPEGVFNGEIGKFAGVRFIETPTAPLFADAGSSTTDTDVYGALFVGRQALAKVWAIKDGNGPVPVIVMGPITDYLRRFQPLGWKWMGAVRRVPLGVRLASGVRIVHRSELDRWYGHPGHRPVVQSCGEGNAGSPPHPYRRRLNVSFLCELRQVRSHAARSAQLPVSCLWSAHGHRRWLARAEQHRQHRHIAIGSPRGRTQHHHAIVRGRRVRKRGPRTSAAPW